MNHVLEAIRRKPVPKSWQDIDNQTDGKVNAYTCITLFLNDQVYAYEAALEQEILKSSLYRQNVKRTFDGLRRATRAYNRFLTQSLDHCIDLMATMLQSLEDELHPSLDTYMWQVSQFLLSKGIEGEANRYASLSSTINMLCQTSDLTIQSFEERVCRRFHVNNILEDFNMHRIRHLSDALCDALAPGKMRANLNEAKGILQALNAFQNRMLCSGAFDRAIERALLETAADQLTT